MTEVNMRRVGVRLVLAVVVTLILVSSVRRQWKSTTNKLAREVTVADEPGLMKAEGAGEAVTTNEDSETVDRVERIDSDLEEGPTEAVAASENVVLAEAEDQVAKEVGDTARNDVTELGNVLTNSSSTAHDETSRTSVILQSGQTVSNMEVSIAAVDDDRDPDAPDYNDVDGQDPNWRATKFAKALYDDEDKDDSIEDFNRVDVNDSADEGKNESLTRQNSSGTSNSKTSLFSWFSLGKYLTFENSMDQDTQNGPKTVNDYKQLDSKPSQNVTLTTDDSFKANSENNNTVTFESRSLAPIENRTEDLATNIIQANGNVFGDDPTQQSSSSDASNKKTLPFEINGIDNPNYDDVDDAIETQAHVPEFTNGVPGFVADSTDPRDSGIQGDNPFGQWNQLKRTFQMGVTQSNKPFSYLPLSTQRFQQQIQPLFFQPQQVQVPPQLSQQHQRFSNPFLSPRVLDFILAENYQSARLNQLPARVQYFIHQNIHRIDQDLDPVANKEPKVGTDNQAQFLSMRHFGPRPTLSSRMTDVIQPVNEEENPNQSYIADEAVNNKVYEDDVSYEDFDTKYDDNSLGNIRSSNDAVREPRSIFTPSPDPAVYDNPRPLSEREFSLFRTQPYKHNVEAESGTYSPIQVKPNDGIDNTEGTGFLAQGLGKPGSTHEDETLRCPREASLAETPHPVTALVAFPDAGTVWVRKLLEQLTGIETDSIYNIMAQLKAGNAASVYNMGRKIAIETHMATDKNFEKAVIVIRNPFAVDAQHRTFRPWSLDWQKTVLWNHTYSTWLNSSLPVHVLTYEDLVENPLTELMKIAHFLASPDIKLSYKCAMKVALDPPSVIDDVEQIVGIYHDDRRMINKNIDYLIQMAQKTFPDIVLRLNSYKVATG